jgi:hypothetical protein
MRVIIAATAGRVVRPTLRTPCGDLEANEDFMALLS